jgi:hypothetical protein
VIAQRTLAVLSAVLLVLAVAVATLGPRAFSLAWALTQLDSRLVETLHGWTDRYLNAWSWSHLAMPLLARPAWMLPAGLGLICLGLSLSLSYRKGTRRSHRRS